MKKEIIEILDFDDDKPKVGRPRLADKKTKRKSIIIASVSFIFVVALLIFGYGTLFGFKNLNLMANVNGTSNSNEVVLIDEISPLVKNITIKKDTARKVYVSILPASASNKNLSYESSDESIAVVDNNGKVVGVNKGNAVITARTTDGTSLTAEFYVKVINNNTGSCDITSLSKTSKGIYYETECNNAKIKEIAYKTDGNYDTLLTKKLSDEIKLSKNQLKNDVTLKVIYYPNNSKITKYVTKTLKTSQKTTTTKTGVCHLQIKEVKTNSAKYDVDCKNATISDIAYKIGNGSYVGIDSSNLADTVLFEESDVTRILYFNVNYTIDGTNTKKTVTESSIIQKAVTTTSTNNNE
ncbi:MAG: Ig-like domain-containing protein [Bacilli bacterium]|nr:Ig-like domain-containing protein [Bacilli bacterium]